MRAAKHKLIAASLVVCLIPALAAARQPAPTPPPPYGPKPAPPPPYGPQPAPPPPYGGGASSPAPVTHARGELTTGQHILFWSGTGIATVGFIALMTSFYYMDVAMKKSDEIEERFGPYGEFSRWDAEAEAIQEEGQLAEFRFYYLLGGGFAMCLVGALMITSGRTRPKKDPAVSIAPTNGGAIVGWSADF